MSPAHGLSSTGTRRCRIAMALSVTAALAAACGPRRGESGVDRAGVPDSATVDRGASLALEPDLEGCVVEETYSWGVEGGLRPLYWSTALVPPDTLRIERWDLFEDERRSCTTIVPRCGTPAAVDVGDVRAALKHPDVEAAWGGGTEMPVFGVDARPMDGAVWAIRKGAEDVGAPSFAVGYPCRDDPACIPAALVDVKELLEALHEQQRATEACRDLVEG